MQIQVLGPGCASCTQLHKNVLEAVKDNKDIKVEYITEISKLLKAGIMSSPALLIDEKIMSIGRVPSVEEIKQYITNSKQGDLTASAGCDCGGCC